MNSTLVDSYREAEDYFFKGISLKNLNLDSGNIAYMTGALTADLNIVCVKSNVSDLNSDLIASKEFFDQDNLPFSLVIPQVFCKPGVQSTLQKNSYIKTEESTAMALNLKNIITNSATNFSDGPIIMANDYKLNEWMTPLIGAFDSPFCISSSYAKMHDLALKNNFKFHHFSLYQEGIPISSITVSVHNTIARIDDVGTFPEFQGKGYATQLMIHALFQSKKYGATYCFLESSGSAFSIYKKLGFEVLFKNNVLQQSPS